MSWIYFQARPSLDGVDCLIFSDQGRLQARHHMTLEGARIRLHDFESAIEDAGLRHLAAMLGFTEPQS